MSKRMRVFHGDPARLALPDPVPSPELLSFVAGRYGLRVDGPKDLGGNFNLNLLVDRHVVRVYGPWVTAERLRELQRIRELLRRAGVPIPDLLPTTDGAGFCTFEECVLEVERYVTGEYMDAPERLLTGMRTLGRLHTLMEHLDVHTPPPIANHLPQELAVDATLDATNLIRSWGPTRDEARYAESADELAGLLPVFDLPSQLVHGDFWGNNVLFDGAEVVAVLDFDFAGMRPRIDDLALPLSYLAQNTSSFDELRPLVDAYDEGSAAPLTSQERRALPFAMARMALFFLQYLLFPSDDAYRQRSRREFREWRGPDCAWWLNALRRRTLSETTFA